MAMYSISVTPLIAALQDPHLKQVWFADDATAGGMSASMIRSILLVVTIWSVFPNLVTYVSALHT